VLGGVLQIGGTALDIWLTHLSEATSRGMRVVGRPPNAAMGLAPDHLGYPCPSDEAQTGGPARWLLSVPIQSEAVSRLTGWRASDRWDGTG